MKCCESRRLKYHSITLFYLSISRYSLDMDKNILIQWAIAKVIREARNALDISQVQLADFSGLSYPFISDVERGNVGVSIAALLQIAEVLKVEASELMRRIEAELKRGPQEPEKVPGRPRKMDKKTGATAASATKE